jgi:hypothetical protein
MKTDVGHVRWKIEDDAQQRVLQPTEGLADGDKMYAQAWRASGQSHWRAFLCIQSFVGSSSGSKEQSAFSIRLPGKIGPGWRGAV